MFAEVFFIMQNVLVVFGGNSTENEISVITGLFVMNTLDEKKYRPVPLYLHTDGKFYSSEEMRDIEFFKQKRYGKFPVILYDGKVYPVKNKKLKTPERVDVALNCCHGGLGEGGYVSAVLETNKIPYASPSVCASSVFLDKCMTKLIAKSLGIPTAPYLKITERDYKKRGTFLLRYAVTKLGFPMIVKPSKGGSSIGIKFVENEGELRSAVENNFVFGTVIVEKYLEGKKDVNCGVYSLGGVMTVSKTEVVTDKNGVYGFADKYLIEKGTESPRPLSKDTEEKIRTYTKALYRKCDMVGLVRIDYLVVGDKVYLGEVNTVPGSLAYYLFCDRLTEAGQLFDKLLEDAIRTGSQEKTVQPASVLESLKGGKKRLFRGVRI